MGSMTDCIVKCSFLRDEAMNSDYKRVWLSFKAETVVKLTVKHTYKKGELPETMVLELSTDGMEKDFVIFAEAEKITLFITDVVTQKSWTIEVPLYLGSEVRYIK